MAERNLIPNATTFYIVINWLAKEENYRDCLNLLPLFPMQESTRNNKSFNTYFLNMEGELEIKSNVTSYNVLFF
ncbi:hypothetical protein ACOSP7_003982 [Xanthoceras sorbifolium]